MASFQVVYEFAESNGATFNEVYSESASSVTAAADVTTTQIATRLALLHPLNKFIRIRSSSYDGGRVTGLKKVNLKGTASTNGPPLPVGAAAVLTLVAQSGKSRKLWLRGIPKDWYQRNPITGEDDPPAPFLTALDAWFSSLTANQFGIRKLAPAGTGAFFPYKILSVDGALGLGNSIVDIGTPPPYAALDRVVIGGASKKDLPALNGHYQVIDVAGNTFLINYQTPNKARIVGGNAKVRKESYSEVSTFSSPNCAFDYYGVRSSKNPLSHSRGAKRAARIRTSL